MRRLVKGVWNVKRTFVLLAVFALSGAVGLGSAVRAFEDKETKKEDDKGTEDTGKKAPLAANVDFTTLELGFSTLETIGSRIDAARLAASPITLASLANELAVAEKVAKKKAKLTSAELYKEATDLAKQRNIKKELEALSLLVQDKTSADELKKLAAKPAEKSRALHGTLHVRNRSRRDLHIYVDGKMIGRVRSGGEASFRVYDRGRKTQLQARTRDGHTYAREYVVGDHRDLT